MDYAELRKNMVRQQLAAREINDQNVLAAFLKIERHKFIAEDLWAFAYEDHPLQIGEGQTISQPYIVALMTQHLSLTGKERVLEIGTGSGYQTAILAELSKEIFSIERISSLSLNAQKNLAAAGYSNVRFRIGDGTLGWPDAAPFDRIILSAACSHIPLPLSAQLNNGGKLIAPLGDIFNQTLTLTEKKNDRLEYHEICGCVFVPLIGKYGYIIDK